MNILFILFIFISFLFRFFYFIKRSLDAHCPFIQTFVKVQIILFIFTIPKFFFLATTLSQKLLSRISFRGFKQFDFLTRGFHVKHLYLFNIPN
jgi:hypothetical protein